MVEDPVHMPTPDNTPVKPLPSLCDSKRFQKNLKSKCRQIASHQDSDTDVRDDKLQSSCEEKSSVTVVTTKNHRRGRKGRRRSKASSKPPSGVKSEGSASGKSKVPKEEEKQQKVLTDFFPIRRSTRTPSAVLKKQGAKDVEEAVLAGREDGLKVTDIPGKGRGVVATRDFKRADFVVEYAGDLIELKDAKKREKDYQMDTSIGCYMYYFSFNNKSYCVDATAESGKLGRLLNHSRNGNCSTKVIGINDRPYLLLVADRDIASGEELLYDYGDRNKESLESHPWLAL